jgi:hypothetical protein
VVLLLRVRYRNMRRSMVASGGDRLVLVDEPAQLIATDSPVGTGPGRVGCPRARGARS